jgi:hypothetical protein
MEDRAFVARKNLTSLVKSNQGDPQLTQEIRKQCIDDVTAVVVDVVIINREAAGPGAPGMVTTEKEEKICCGLTICVRKFETHHYVMGEEERKAIRSSVEAWEFEVYDVHGRKPERYLKVIQDRILYHTSHVRLSSLGTISGVERTQQLFSADGRLRVIRTDDLDRAGSAPTDQMAVV